MSIFCHFSEKYDYLFGLGEKFGQFFWVPRAVERYQNRPGYVPDISVSTGLQNVMDRYRTDQKAIPYNGNIVLGS